MSDEKLIERYHPDFDEGHDGCMHFIGMDESEAGEYVKFVDAKGIIDALTARVAELERDYRDDMKQALAGIEAANARADAAERAKAEWERLRGEAYSLYRTEAEKRARVESEAAELRAEVERLGGETARADRRAQMHCDGRSELESRLSTATELLRRSIPVMSDQILREVDAFLQATAPAPTEREAAERKVLEAMSGLEEDWLMACQKLKNDAVWPTLATAELARRAVKP